MSIATPLALFIIPSQASSVILVSLETKASVSDRRGRTDTEAITHQLQLCGPSNAFAGQPTDMYR